MSISRAWLLCAALASCARPGAGGRRPSSLTPRDRATIRRILHEWRDVKDGGLGLPIGDGAAAADNATDGGAAGAIAGVRLAPHPSTGQPPYTSFPAAMPTVCTAAMVAPSWLVKLSETFIAGISGPLTVFTQMYSR